MERFFRKKGGHPISPPTAPCSSTTNSRKKKRTRKTRSSTAAFIDGSKSATIGCCRANPPLARLRDQTTTRLLHRRGRSDRSHCLQSMEAAGSSSNKRGRPIRALRALIRQGRSATRRRDEACFAEPVSLPQMVDVLVNLWEAEGLDI